MARPIQFNREEVIEQALQAFWDRGYCATGMAKLVDVTHLKPGSLYAAFDSKQGLFLAALDRYGEQSAERLRHQLEGADSPLQGIGAFLRSLATAVESGEVQGSCLLVNSALELARHDDEIREHVNRHFAIIERALADALRHAQDQGEIAADRNCDELASFLMNNIWGLRVLAGTGPPMGRARQIVEQILLVLH